MFKIFTCHRKFAKRGSKQSLLEPPSRAWGQVLSAAIYHLEPSLVKVLSEDSDVITQEFARNATS